MTPRVLALDIECTPRTDPPNFDDPAGNWDTFAIALSFRQDAQSDPETVVLIRRSDSEHDLRKLLCAAANWIQDKRPLDCLVGYNSESFDMPILNHHIDTIETDDESLAAFIRSALDISHRDLFAEAVNAQPDSVKYPSLAEALAEREIECPVAKLDGSTLDGGDMPALGARVLAEDDSLTLRERAALREYAKSDVVPLFQLADCLKEERSERIAAEARAIAKTGQNTTGGTPR